MKQLLTITLLLVVIGCFAQYTPDTIYLNSNLNKTRKAKAEYYRVFYLDQAGVYHSTLYSRKHSRRQTGTYLDNRFTQPHGNVINFYESGKAKDTATYISGSLTGIAKSYYENGQLKRFERYFKDSLVGGLYYNPDGTDTTLPPFLAMPKYNEGTSALNRFIQQNISYPREAARRGIQGVVYVGFIVGKEGEVNTVKVIRSPDPSLNYEAQRIIELTSRNWLPGYKEGEPADMGVTVPVYFLLEP